MTLTTSSSEILKQDSRGRVRYTKQKREQLLQEFDKSGLSGAKFAAMVGVTYSTFAGWCSRRAKAGAKSSSSKAAPVEWLEAVVAAKQPTPLEKSTSLLLTLPSGAQIEIASPTQIHLAAELLRQLEKRPC
jgi:hypothetical protein